MVAEYMIALCTSWKTIGIYRICSIINDSNRLLEEMEQRNETNGTNYGTNKIGDRATQDLAELSMCALNLLTERMMYDLQNPVVIISSVGGKEWEADERGQAIATALASHRQMLSNKRKWLSTSHYFPKVLRSCFNLTLPSSCESFYCNNMAQGISNPSMVPLNLVIFFNGSLFENFQGKSGFTLARR
jgi:hypothetical protein